MVYPNQYHQMQWFGDSGGPCFDADGSVLGVTSGGDGQMHDVEGALLPIVTPTYATLVKSDRVALWALTVMTTAISNDFNSDGRADILWHNSTTGQSQAWHLNAGVRTSTRDIDALRDGGAALATASAPWRPVGSNDFDGDGMPDELWHNDTTHETQIWFLSGTSRIRRGTVKDGSNGLPILIGPPWSIVSSADFNRDGKSDILWYNSSSGEIRHFGT